MKSKWFESKPEAVRLRTKGLSIKTIEERLGIPRSTLSGWFRNVSLTKKQKTKLQNNWKQSLVQARKSAAAWHTNQKKKRLREAEDAAMQTLETIDVHHRAIPELALAMLYLGEGMKGSATCMGNSNPLILRFFITILVRNYGIDRRKIRCELHLRADQNPEQMKRYWSKTLALPRTNFTSTSIDTRTTGSPTYSYYKGVCVVRCGTVAIQRKLLYLSHKFCQEVIAMGG